HPVKRIEQADVDERRAGGVRAVEFEVAVDVRMSGGAGLGRRSELERRRSQFDLRELAPGGAIDGKKLVGGLELRYGGIGAPAFGIAARRPLEAEQVLQRRLHLQRDTPTLDGHVQMNYAVLVGAGGEGRRQREQCREQQ